MVLVTLKKRLLKTRKSDTRPAVLDEAERIQIATCVILLEVARSDYEFHSLEKETVSAILKKKFHISEQAVQELMEIARKRREESIDLWEYTHLINKNYSREEKMKVVEAAWKVIYADEKLDKYEDHLVHKLARLLRLSHSELIRAKLKVRDEVKT
ncbi:MAG: TerB family tellurite resistance protein [Candidatus Aminicenantes bacterium]